MVRYGGGRSPGILWFTQGSHSRVGREIQVVPESPWWIRVLSRSLRVFQDSDSCHLGDQGRGVETVCHPRRRSGLRRTSRLRTSGTCRCRTLFGHELRIHGKRMGSPRTTSVPCPFLELKWREMSDGDLRSFKKFPHRISNTQRKM